MLTTIFVFVVALITTKIHAQQACQLTDPDILGPYYIPGAPRSVEQLCASSPANDRLVLTGQVVDYDSKCTRGIANVKLDLWQVIKNKKESNGFS
jgi:protocatechuate 3,4-dioxygenase beta subunit